LAIVIRLQARLLFEVGMAAALGVGFILRR